VARYLRVKDIKPLHSFSKTDPRSISRITKVFGFIVENLCIDEEVEISSDTFSLILGDHELARLLKSKLFICTDSSYIPESISEKAGKLAYSKKYKLNPEGIIEVANYFNIGQPEIAPTIFERVSKRFHNELSTGDFKYKTTSNRDYHFLSSGVNKNTRNEILSSYGFNIEYDVVSAAPTILYNEYLKITSVKLPALEQYLQNPKQFRTEVAQETNCPYEKVKRLITAFAYNADFNRHKDKSALEIAETMALLETWIANKRLKSLHRAFKKLYKVIKVHHNHKDARAVSLFYFEIEERIRDVLINYCQEHNIQKFIIHDAIVVKQKLDTDELSDRIENAIGYKVYFSTSIL
jgi:hypothetical protein